MQQQDKVQIIIKGIDQTDDIQSWTRSDDKIHITYKNGNARRKRRRSIQQQFRNRERFGKTAKIQSRFYCGIFGQYRQQARIYRITKAYARSAQLGAFLKGAIKPIDKTSDEPAIFPFGFNLSQKIAVDNALENPLSVIEGSPGTGKTQTILNIIANAVTSIHTAPGTSRS